MAIFTGARANGYGRREFLAMVAGSLAASATGCANYSTAPIAPDAVTLRARPHAPVHTPTPGYQPLGLWPSRDSLLFVPDDYRPDRPASLFVVLHGAGGSAQSWLRMPFADLVRDLNVVVLIPSSFGSTWAYPPGADSDVRRIDDSLAAAFERVWIDETRVAFGGFSDGASFALSVGIANGDFFNTLVAFSPGFIETPVNRGTPRIYISHGTYDSILPIELTSRRFVPFLRNAGYEVRYDEFAGGHEVTYENAEAAMTWFLSPVGD